MLPYPPRPRRVALVGAAALLLTLPAAPLLEAGIGRELWADPSAGPIVDDFTDFWALFVLSLNDPHCSAFAGPLGFGDLDIAKDLRDALLAEGVPASRITILLDRGDDDYAAASEVNVRNWLAATAEEASTKEAPRVFVMMAGHGAPYAPGSYPVAGWRISRPAGSSICLAGGGEMLDYEFASYLRPFASHVQLGLAVSCSLCGGFADRVVGPVDTYGEDTVAANRVVAAGCGLVTECTGDWRRGSTFFQLLADGIVTRSADGWTYLGRDDAMTPYDSRVRDGLVTLEEAYWYALGRSATHTTPVLFAAAQRFQLRDTLDGGFAMAGGGAASAPNAGTGGCLPDASDYDGDGVPDAVDVVNARAESREAVAAGGFVRTDFGSSSVFKLVVTSPSGNSATFQGGQTNNSLDVFIGEPVDGTWLVDQRSLLPHNHVVEVYINGKTLRDNHVKTLTDAGVTAWNWHTGSRTDDSLVLDVDPCAASSLRIYVEAPVGGTP